MKSKKKFNYLEMELIEIKKDNLPEFIRNSDVFEKDDEFVFVPKNFNFNISIKNIEDYEKIIQIISYFNLPSQKFIEDYENDWNNLDEILNYLESNLDDAFMKIKIEKFYKMLSFYDEFSENIKNKYHDKKFSKDAIVFLITIIISLVEKIDRDDIWCSADKMITYGVKHNPNRYRYFHLPNFLSDSILVYFFFNLNKREIFLYKSIFEHIIQKIIILTTEEIITGYILLKNLRTMKNYQLYTDYV